ncbi:MAG: hypothetical protein IJE45_04750 [Bacilli bacterium]|nr:hypothetical protein [Bacilli bacterium]
MKYDYILKFNWVNGEPISPYTVDGHRKDIIYFMVISPDGRDSKLVPFSWLCNNQDRIACMQITSDNQVVYSDEWYENRRPKKNLKKADIPILLNMGCSEEEIEQINNTVYLTDYTYRDDSGTYNISAKRAREILGDEEFLSGLARSSFHYNSGRHSSNGYVSFCSKRYFAVDGIVL